MWEVKAAGWVGAAVLGDPRGVCVDLRVAPKVGITRLLFLLGYADGPKTWRDDPVIAPEASDVPSAVAEAFARLADRALLRGVLQGYRTVEESGLTFRGRMREADQMRRRFGMALPVEVVYDDYGCDIAENQILRAALWRVLAIPGVPPLARRRLIRQLHRLAEVTDLPTGQQFPTWHASQLNARYQSVLRLATLILRSSSFDLGRGAVPASGFLVSMPAVFEAFVTVALGWELERQFGGRVVAQDSGWWLDQGREINLRPDLVWYPSPRRDDRSPGLVIDAKYKAEKYGGFPNPDVYQLLAYCSALRLPVGHLVYAKGNEPVREYLLPHTGVDGAGVTVRVHTLDLEIPPEGLLKQVAELAGRVGSGLEFTGRGSHGQRLR